MLLSLCCCCICLCSLGRLSWQLWRLWYLCCWFVSCVGLSLTHKHISIYFVIVIDRICADLVCLLVVSSCHHHVREVAQFLDCSSCISLIIFFSVSVCFLSLLSACCFFLILCMLMLFHVFCGCDTADICTISNCSSAPNNQCFFPGFCYHVNHSCSSSAVCMNSSNQYGSFQCQYSYQLSGSACRAVANITGTCDASGACWPSMSSVVLL